MVRYITEIENITPGSIFTGAEAREFYKSYKFPDSIVFIDLETGEAPVGLALSETYYVVAVRDLREPIERISKYNERLSKDDFSAIIEQSKRWECLI